MFKVTISQAATDIGGQDVQQDNGVAIECVGDDGRMLVVAGVFDGHGKERGHHFSQLAVDTLKACVTDSHFKQRFDASPETVGREIFAKITSACLESNCQQLSLLGHEYVVENGQIYPTMMSSIDHIAGGSTGTVVMVSDTGVVHTFNVGDSDAWFVAPGNATRLNASHAPDSASEYERIHATWPETGFFYHYQVKCGRARRAAGSHIFPRRANFDGYYVKNVSGDYAAIMTVGVQSLAMTRSFADAPLRHGGLISEPSYSVHQATESSIVHVASDGYWDNIKDTEMASQRLRAVEKYGYNAEKLNRDWFLNTESDARANFGSGRDNMWGYTIVLEQSA